MTELKNIRNLQELEQAFRAVEKKLAARQDALNKDLYRVQHLLDPLNLADASLHAVVPAAPSLRSSLLNKVRSLKKLLQ